MTRRGVVLGGGGVAGIAWETGLLAGLAEAGRAILDADLFVGTSAGATVAAQVTSGVPLPELYQRQVDPARQAPELPAVLDAEAIGELFGAAYAQATSPLDMRRRIGALALAATTVPESERRAVIAARLPNHSWPEVDLRIVAVDARTGEEHVFDRSSGVELVDAVAASYAVPVTWPPVTIGADRYLDGGVRSAENADFAAGCARVLIVQVLEIPESPELDNQVAALRAEGARASVIRPDEAANAALGPNLLDPGVRTPAGKAGYEQGLREAEALAWFWA